MYEMVSLQYLGIILGQNTCRIICGCTVNVSMGFFRNQIWYYRGRNVKRLNISLADHFLTSMILSFYDINGLNFIPVKHHNLTFPKSDLVLQG